jgi:hypothetical protein
LHLQIYSISHYIFFMIQCDITHALPLPSNLIPTAK